MEILLWCMVVLSVIMSVLPLINSSYWVFRICTFAKVQILFFQLILLFLSFFSVFSSLDYTIYLRITLLGFIFYHVYKLAKYSGLYAYSRKERKANVENCFELTLLSFNVYQFSKQYHSLIKEIETNTPDLVFLVETNEEWLETVAEQISDDYPYSIQIPLENTYGMALFSKFKLKKEQVNYFIAQDLPSIEVEVCVSDQDKITFFGVHPPPPSPTEEATSLERDGELMAVAKKARTLTTPVLVAGDFNTVSWSRESQLFEKVSGLKDARIGRGLINTYHARYWLIRFPIDLFYHSADVWVKKIVRLQFIGSDHFPVLCKFLISRNKRASSVPFVAEEERFLVNKIIKEGEEETSEVR